MSRTAPTGAWDYIVAGGGAGGATLAARLAQDPAARVLLVEAGGPGRSLFISMPAGNGWLFGNPAHDWGLTTVPQPGLDGRRIAYPRGRGLGGSTIMNGMIYIRGSAHDFDRWQARGLAGWGFNHVLPYFRRAEGHRSRGTPWHGTTGPLTVCPAANHTALDQRFVAAAIAAGHDLNPDFNGPSQHGVGRLDVMVDGGRRQSAARAYLRRPPPNLTILTGLRVLSVEIQHGRARGLRVLEAPGTVRVLQATQEVVLALGSLATPQVMMLSGMGPADHLRRHGVPVVADLPGVGSHLADHLNMPVQFACIDRALSFARHQRLDRALSLGTQWLLARRGPGAAPFWSACLFAGLDGGPLPDLQVFFTPMVVKEARDGGESDDTPFWDRLGRRVLVRGSRMALCGYQFDINQMHPDALGTVRLASADPLTPPLIDPAFLTGDRVLRQLIDGVLVMREIAAQAPLSEVTGGELSPGPTAATRQDLARAVRQLATTGHHPVGTCRMGPPGDPMSVVDAALRVRGIDGLRICDASIFPDQLTGNPTAPVIMIAEKAADMILGRAALAPHWPDRQDATPPPPASDTAKGAAAA